jgi:CIC family chloride channel protein
VFTAGIAATLSPIAGVLFAIEFDVSISAFTPMIAAATGALVSEIVLDETILLNFRQQQVFDYHKIPFIFSWEY